MSAAAQDLKERACGSSNFSSPDSPTWDLYARCIHCGLCLNQCPTYRVLGTEMDSPRGRIYQVLQVDSGRLALQGSFVLHMDRCLGCRACESACSSGVSYGRILERSRVEIEQAGKRPWLGRTLRGWFFRSVLPNAGMVSRLARILRFYQSSGIQAGVRRTGLLKLVGLSEIEALAPRVDQAFFYGEIGKTFPAEGERRARVALLAGCVANVTATRLHHATIRVLQKNGVEVVVPKEQTCCGALSAHAGFLDHARELARRNIDALLRDDFDAVVNNAGGCGAALKEYEEWLEHDDVYAEKARKFTAKIRDISEFLVELRPRKPAGRLNIQVTYQDSCHLAHGQRIFAAPRELLRLAGAELIEMPRADSCCGGGGTYNVTQNQLSMRILDAKMRDVAATGAQVLACSNLGCMLQLRTGVERAGLRVQVSHVVELLDGAYSPDV